jgi:hypothetical protein
MCEDPEYGHEPNNEAKKEHERKAGTNVKK